MRSFSVSVSKSHVQLVIPTYFVHKIAQNIQEYNGIAVQIYYRRRKWHYFGKDQSHLKEKKKSFKAVEFFSKKQQNKKFTLI